jgi:hypothetical protein
MLAIKSQHDTGQAKPRKKMLLRKLFGMQHLCVPFIYHISLNTNHPDI